MRVGLSLFSLLVFAGSAELICRIWYEPQQVTYPGIFEYDADKVYRLKKSLKGGMFAGKPVTTNSFGYRDVEISVEKGSDVIRVLVIGDSITFGHGVLVEQTYSNLLEEKLNREVTDFRFDVINTAVPGNSPFQEFFDLERALIFHPDVVIAQFVLNDVVEPFKVLRRYGGTGKDYHKVHDAYWLDLLLRQHSAFYLFLTDVYREILSLVVDIEKRREIELKKARSLDWNLAAHEPKNETERELWAECLKQLQLVVELCRRENIPLLLFVSPVDFQLEDSKRTYAQRRLKEFADENKVTYFDLLPNLREVSRLANQQQTRKLSEEETVAMNLAISKQVWNSFFLDYDHYNANGHRFVVEHLYPVLLSLLKEKVRRKPLLPDEVTETRAVPSDAGKTAQEFCAAHHTYALLSSEVAGEVIYRCADTRYVMRISLTAR